MARFPRLLIASLAAALALAATGTAVAGDIGVTLGFKAGALGLKAQGPALGGTVRVPLTVVDARGNGAGWSLRLAGAGSPTVTRIAMRCAAGSTCTLPRAAVSLPATVGSTGTTVFSAGRNSGMGAIELTLTVSGGHGPLTLSVR